MGSGMGRFIYPGCSASALRAELRYKESIVLPDILWKFSSALQTTLNLSTRQKSASGVALQLCDANATHCIFEVSKL